MEYFFLHLIESFSIAAFIALIGFGGYFLYRSRKDEKFTLFPNSKYNKRIHRIHRKKYGYLRNFDIKAI